MSNEEELSKLDALIAQHDVSKALPEAERGPGGRRPPRFNADTPPPWYRCHRCGQNGHFVQSCPTLTAEDQALLKNVKQARGIPRAFLQKATEEDLKRAGTGGYLSATGELLMLRQATAEEKTRIVGETETQRLRKFFGDAQWEVQKELLTCGLCGTLFKEAVVTPCCSSVCCKECLMKHLEKTFSILAEENTRKNRQCVNCPAIIQLDQVIPDIRLQNLVAQILYGELAVLKTARAQQPVQQTADKEKEKPKKKKKIDIALSLGAEEEDVELVQEPAARFQGLVKVPAGPLNPFFAAEDRKMTKAQFDTWQKKYVDALAKNALLDKLLHKQKLLVKAEQK